MAENTIGPLSDDRLSIAWAVLVVATAGLIATPGVRRYVRGAPTEEWIVDIVLGALLLTLYFGTRLAYWFETDRSSAEDGFQLSDWTILVVTGIWVLASAAFIAGGLSSIGVVGFLLFGAIGFVAMLYRLYAAGTAASTRGS